MIRVTVLGTAGASPTRERNLASVALSYDGDVFLFDCGEGTQRQLILYGVNPSRIRALFISHAHGDHVIGIAGLVRTLALNGRTEPLAIYVPKGAESAVRSLALFDRARMAYRIEIRGIRAGKVYAGDGFSVSAFRLSHTVPTYGYAFKLDDRRRFIEERAKALGIVGEMHSVLQRKGSMRIGGKRVRLADVTTLKRGEKVVYAADTRPTGTTVSAAKGADLLLHESTYAEAEKGLAAERGHSTAHQAATVARKAGAKRLVLFHFSARYRSTAQLEAEARKAFPGAIMAKDGDEVSI